MNLPKVLTCLFEKVGLRGAPTLLTYLSRTALGQKTATVRLPYGQEITFSAYDPYWARHLYAHAPYERDVEAIFRRFSAGRTLIDCGANIGYWSTRAKELGFTAAIAIEANSTLIPFLSRNFDGLVYHAAVHSKSGDLLWLNGEGAVGRLGATGKPVKSLALSDLSVHGPVLIKLDVEGAEIPAIQGAKGMDAIFVCEDWPNRMAVTDYLLSNGFSVFGFDMTPLQSCEQAAEHNRRTNVRFGPSNIVAIPKESVSRLSNLKD